MKARTIYPSNPPKDYNEWMEGIIKKKREMTKQNEGVNSLKTNKVDTLHADDMSIGGCDARLIANAIQNGGAKYGVKNAQGEVRFYPLPAPQRAGTMTQCRTYAMMCAERIVDQAKKDNLATPPLKG